MSLLDGAAAWHFAQVLVPDIAWYRERYVLHFSDLVVELEFPAPYLNHQPTDLWVRRSQGLRLDTTHVRAGYGEAFVRELEGFWDSVVNGTPVRNPVEDAATATPACWRRWPATRSGARWHGERSHAVQPSGRVRWTSWPRQAA